MMKHSAIYKTFDVLVVPFPFTDKPGTKNRPAIVMSSPRSFNVLAGHTVLAMITNAENDPWPLDILIEDFKSYGLNKPCVIRMKLFTIDNRLIKKYVGSLDKKDQKKLIAQWKHLFNELV